MRTKESTARIRFSSIASSGIRSHHFLCCLLFAFILVLSVRSVIACKLPVFRYALERWSVDRYRLVALVSDPNQVSVREALETLEERRGGQWNAQIEIVNLNEMTEDQWWLFEGLDDGAKDQLQVYFPTGKGEDRLGWSGELSTESVKLWSSSPIRDSLVMDLAKGVSAVWLLVEGDDAAVNDQLEKDLRSTLERANRDIKIPEGVIAPDDAAQYFQENPGASMDDVLRCAVPLKVEFQMRRLSQADKREAATIAILRSLGVNEGEACLVPVFGRGRMLDAIPAEPYPSDVILKACQYMVGECSCTVKAQNPGVDLLLNVDWQQKLGVEEIVFGSGSRLAPELLNVPAGKDSIVPANAAISEDQAKEPEDSEQEEPVIEDEMTSSPSTEASPVRRNRLTLIVASFAVGFMLFGSAALMYVKRGH